MKYHHQHTKSPATVAPPPTHTLVKVDTPTNVETPVTLMSLETSSRLIVPTPVIFRFLPDTSSYTTSSKT